MARLAGHPQTLSRTTRAGAVASQALLLAAVSVYLGRLASAGSVGMELGGLFLLAAIALAVAVPPHLFLALALLVFGAYSLSGDSPFTFAGAEVYSTDVLLAVVLLRAILPRDRIPTPAPLDGLARLLFGIWAVVMVVAGLRSALDGHDLVSIIRLETPLIYAGGFYFGLGRIIRERAFDLDKATRNLLIVALGFVAYMAFARLTNSPFETDHTSGGNLGSVITTGGELRRDYGLASAFILYPVLALAGTAYLLYSPRRTATAAVVASIGILTTLLTLIRGEIFGLFIGLAVIAFMRSEGAIKRAIRTRALVAASFALLIAGLALWVVSPPTARAVVERSLPWFTQQSEAAESTAEFRRKALDVGVSVAEREPAGLGLLPGDALEAASVSPGYLAHSAPAALLVYGGWIALIAAVTALLGLIGASFRAPRPVPWLHPWFIGSLLMLVVYSFAASGLMGQGWVIALAALIAALRFNAAEPAK
jgi:hypothetical protein